MKHLKILASLALTLALSGPVLAATAQQLDNCVGLDRVNSACTAVFQFYQAGGRYLAYVTRDYGQRQLYWSPNGHDFWPLMSTGVGSESSGGSFVEYHETFIDPRNNDRPGEVNLKDQALILDGRTRYNPVRLDPAKVGFKPFPRVRIPEYLYKSDDDTDFYLLVTADKYEYDYDTFRLFAGPMHDLRPQAIREVHRYRDGGTTYVVTAGGTLFAPVPDLYPEQGPPKWGKRWLQRLDLGSFDIRELPGRAEVVSKATGARPKKGSAILTPMPKGLWAGLILLAVIGAAVFYFIRRSRR